MIGRRAIPALVAAALCAWSAAARAGDVEEARKHYARGVELYGQGADVAALAELERAYQLAPNWKVTYELGVVELQLHDFAAALRYFERYLEEGKDAVQPPRRREVEAQIGRLREQVATLDVRAPPAADVFLDDQRAGTAPLAKPIVVNPGHHTLRTAKDGVTSETQRVAAAGGDHLSVELTLPEPVLAPAPVAPAQTPIVATPISPAPAVEAPPVEAPPSRVWIGWLVTGAFACGSLATGIEALSTNASLSRAKADAPTSGDSLTSLSSRARGFAIASDVMTGAALVSGGLTLYLTLRQPSRHAPPPASARVELGAGRLSVVGTF
jgi:hypothetical protein